MNGNYDYNQQPIALLSNVMRAVYLKMTGGLAISGLVAWIFSTSNFIRTMGSGTMWLLFGLEIILVIAISGGINRMKASTATMLFYLFAVVNGLALAPIFIIYTGVSIAKTFFITAGTFGAMSVFGYTTNQDLSRMGSLLYMALFGLIIATVVNLIWPNGTLGFVISIAGVLIFIGLTAWDTQQIKNMASMMPADQVGRLSTLGALTLYLDFINLFLYLLRFFGSSRD